MLCDECKEREGVVSVTKMQKDSMTLENLCEKCAAARGIETTVTMPKHPLSDFLSGVQQQLGGQQADAARCTFCSTTLRSPSRRLSTRERTSRAPSWARAQWSVASSPMSA